MKTILLTAAFVMGSFAYAGTGVVFTDTDQASIAAAQAKLKRSGCKVYAVEFTNGGYRVDRFGNLQPKASKAAVKYNCPGNDD